ncbi:unnamed protein product [Rotaria sordida]|uniref:Uncharacterized protein n=1 Tax=Rotaria sordida TaxID=392033 RepID=A0A819Z2A1_9BILA|nr:unnamed protein product [Rotaria sordida]CAF1334502.1 unnamed protein product [Rotaria sordida]CAF4122052.1 unnamed protein product [Rotaria sordida]CAF4167463.1 unnamed protein product [Rotaria sordida]CAF4236525.1 unnamed protein product [Rotaria sordida]
MFHTTVTLILCFTFLQIISSQNLNGIFLIDSCECNSSIETCESNGPFILNQKRSTLTVKYGSVQIGVGTLGNNQLGLYLNQNRCKGLWNEKNHLAELKCQHQGGIICTTKLRCISGSCLDDTSITISSASIKTTISFLFMIGILIMLV